MDERLSHYSDFWMKFQKVMRDDCQCFPQNYLWMEPDEQKVGEHVLFLKELILLKGLPCKSLTGNLDAIVDYKEWFLKPPFEVPARTSIFVHYCLRELGNNHAPQLLYSLRFDYHPKIGNTDGDPITHVHVKHEHPRKYPAAYRGVHLKQNDAVRRNASFKLLGHGRMPTPLMPLPGVLCLLVADHFGSVVQTLINETSSTLDSITMPSTYVAWYNKHHSHHKSDSIGWDWYTY